MAENSYLRLLRRLGFVGLAASVVLTVAGIIVSGMPGPTLEWLLFVLAAIAFATGLVSQVAVFTVRALQSSASSQVKFRGRQEEEIK